MASRIAVMSEGRFLQVGAPAEIYETPSTCFVADFIGNVNLMEGTVTEVGADHLVVDCGEIVHRIGRTIGAAQGATVTVAVRPEKMRIGRGTEASGAVAFNTACGVVKDMAYFGSYTVYHLKLASGGVVKINQSNTEREAGAAISWDDAATATWADTAQVVLTR